MPFQPDLLQDCGADTRGRSVFIDEGPKSGLHCSSSEDLWMPENAVVRARIDETTKAEAAAVLASMGLSLSDAFRLLLKRVAAEKTLPFDLNRPNAKTVAAMKAARAGDLVTVGRQTALLTHLNADD